MDDRPQDVKAEQTPGGSCRLPGECARGTFNPEAGAQLKAELIELVAGKPEPSDEDLATEIIQRRRS